MHTQLSNRNINSYRLFIVLVFSFLFLGLFIFPPKTGNPNTAFILLSLALFFVYYLFIGRFYKMEIDSKNLYFSNSIKKGKIALDKVISVRHEQFPNTFFFKTAYGITVRYFNDQGKVKKVKFLSPETHWGGDPSQIPELKYLKSKITRK